MKEILVSILVLFFGLGFVSCSDSGPQKISFEEKPSPIMLEVDFSDTDPLGSLNGRKLDFRFYKNGEFEYEKIDENKLEELNYEKGGKLFYSEVIEKEQGLLSKEETAEFLNLLSDENLFTAGNYKNAKGFCTCAASRLEIRYRADESLGIRNIVIDGAGCADLTDPSPEYFPHFPNSISKLLKKIEETKSRFEKSLDRPNASTPIKVK